MSQPDSHPSLGGFHHVAIKVADFEAALRFYQEGFGFTEKVAWGEGPKRAIMLDTGNGGILEIFAGGDPEAPSEARMIHFAIGTSDVDAAFNRALTLGATERLAPKDVELASSKGPFRIRIAFVISPTGEVVEFIEEKSA